MNIITEIMKKKRGTGKNRTAGTGRWDNRGSCTDGTKNRAGEYIIL